MLLPESLPVFYSIGLVVLVSATVFAWRFHVFRKNSLKNLYILPSIIVTGSKLSGKTSFIKTITGKISNHAFEDGLQLGYLKNKNQILQLVELPLFTNANTNNLEKIKKMNIKSVVYLFDVSKDSEPIEVQLKNFENLRNIFNKIFQLNLPFIIVANKIDIAEKEKMEKIKGIFGRLYQISALEKLSRKQELLEELNDLDRLVHDLSYDTSQKELMQSEQSSYPIP